MQKKASITKIAREIRRKTRRRFSAKERIRIAIQQPKSEKGITSICRRAAIAANPYCLWIRQFLERERSAYLLLMEPLANFFRISELGTSARDTR